MMTNQLDTQESDNSETEEIHGESYEYGSDKENIAIQRVYHDQDEEEASSSEEDGSVIVEGVVPFSDTASACSEVDEVSVH
jgi:hypothetical protein